MLYTVYMKQKGRRRRFHNISLKEQIRRHPRMFALYVLLRTSVILVMIAQILNRDWQNVMLCCLVLFLYTMPSFIENNWHIDIPDTLEVIVYIFIYAAEILGEIRAYYISVPGWDTALHTVTGFLAAAVGFSLVDIINRNENTKLNLAPLYVAIGAFTFSMTIGVIWEFFEFFMDMFFHLDMQKDTVVNGESLGLNGNLDIGLIDTMKDLFVTFIGATVFSIIGFIYLKNRGTGKFAKRFIPTMMSKAGSEDPADGSDK